MPLFLKDPGNGHQAPANSLNPGFGFSILPLGIQGKNKRECQRNYRLHPEKYCSSFLTQDIFSITG